MKFNYEIGWDLFGIEIDCFDGINLILKFWKLLYRDVWIDRFFVFVDDLMMVSVDVGVYGK